MNTILVDELRTAITQAFQQLGIASTAEVEFDWQPLQGDVSSNIALKAAKTSGFKGSPRQLADQLATQLSTSSHLKNSISKVEAAGPGFINIFLSDEYFLAQLPTLTQSSFSIEPSTQHSQKVIIEFTDPNPFKEFHIGHLYSNTVGEGICRLYEATGAHVLRACYQGDVGMHVAKSVWGMQRKMADDSLQLADLASQPLSDRVRFLGQAYSLGATAFEENPAAQEEMKFINFLTFVSAQENLQETANWEPQVDYQQYLKDSPLKYQEIKELYLNGRAWSLEYFDTMYARLGMKFDEYFFESVVGEYGVKIVKEFLAKGIFKESQGAVIFPGSEYGLHDRVFINSLGLPTYECKELGLAPEKYRRFAYEKSIVITGNEINEYFKVLLVALSKTNPELAAKTTHMSHGMVRLPEGKMSSRTGKILTGEWLLNEAATRVRAILAETRPELSEVESADIAEKVGLAAIKYAFLKSGIGKDIAFSFEESLSFQGNSGPYLLYSYVRAHSILEKAEKLSITNQYDPLLYVLSDSEKAVLKQLHLFSHVLELAAADHAPHQLCTYLFELAQAFNGFYTQHSVLGEAVKPEEQAMRLQLTQAVEQVLASGLHILAIEPIAKM